MLYIQVYQAILCQNNNFIAQLHLYGCLYRFLMAGAVQVAANFLVKPVDGHCPGFVPSYLIKIISRLLESFSLFQSCQPGQFIMICKTKGNKTE